MASWRLGYVLRVRVSVELFYSKPGSPFSVLVGLHNYDVRVQILGLFLRAYWGRSPVPMPVR